jgi:hypothetical protein
LHLYEVHKWNKHAHQREQQADTEDVTKSAGQHDQEADADSQNGGGIISSPLTPGQMEDLIRVIFAFRISPLRAVSRD